MLKRQSLTERHYQTLESAFLGLQGNTWSLDNPVFLFDRCWLRLEEIRLVELKVRLPPDNSEEAPELIKYNYLLEKGTDHLLAVQECWLEFGIEDFHRALRNHWYWQDKGNNGWTFKDYIELFNKYRKSFEYSSISIPLIILGRENSICDHAIKWVVKADSKNSIQISSAS